jgi:penicillin-binding protein 2
VLATVDPSTRARAETRAAPPEDLKLSPENIKTIMQAMVGVTQEGTSARAFAGAAYLSGGKTGTAQAVSLAKNEKYNAARMDERQRDHALYIAFAPAQDPQIALAVIVENAGFGSASAAPIARRVFDYWLLQQYPNDEDLLAVRKGQATAPIGKPRAVAEVSWPPAPPTMASAVPASAASRP